MRVNPETLYVERFLGCGRKRKLKSKTYSDKNWRNWFLIKARPTNPHSPNYYCGYLGIDNITLPPKLVGKRIRLRVEIIEEEVVG